MKLKELILLINSGRLPSETFLSRKLNLKPSANCICHSPLFLAKLSLTFLFPNVVLCFFSINEAFKISDFWKLVFPLPPPNCRETCFILWKRKLSQKPFNVVLYRTFDWIFQSRKSKDNSSAVELLKTRKLSLGIFYENFISGRLGRVICVFAIHTKNFIIYEYILEKVFHKCKLFSLSNFRTSVSKTWKCYQELLCKLGTGKFN